MQCTTDQVVLSFNSSCVVRRVEQIRYKSFCSNMGTAQKLLTYLCCDCDHIVVDLYIPGTYLVRPHLIQRIWSRWGLRLGGQSVRKEADRCISCSFKTIPERVDSCWVNYTLVETVPSVNYSFTEKVESHIWHLFFAILVEWPLVRVLSLKVNMLSKLITDHPLYILNTCK